MRRKFVTAWTEDERLCKDSSKINAFIDTDDLDQEISENYGKQLFRDITDDIFRQQQGFFEESRLPSTESLTSCSSEYKVDRRLKYWKDMLKQRRAVQQKLNLITDKKPEQMLFNRLTSIDNRDKETIKRLLDYADRIDLPDHRLDQLLANEGFEITGLPKHASIELMGSMEENGRSTCKWLKSPMLERRLKVQFPKIKRFVEFVPNVNDLEVIGKSIPVFRTGEFESLYSISNETVDQSKQLKFICNKTNITDESPILGLIINGFQCKLNNPEYAPIKDKLFTCNPFERRLQTVLSLENNGRHVLSFSWTRGSYFSRNSTLFDTKDEEFVFDNHNFYLKPGEKHEVRILFQPRKVCIVKEKWLLRTRPRLFFNHPSAISLNLHGRCTPTEAYVDSLKVRRKQMLLNFSRSLECKSHTPILANSNPRLLPSILLLDERELFNNRNNGFHCNSYADFERLKELYQHANKDPNCQWSLKIDDLVHLICRETCLDERIQHFKDLQQLLERLRCEYASRHHRDSEVKNAQCKRTCFIYIRGIVGNAIEVWEELILLLEAQLLKSALKQYNASTVIESDENVVTLSDIQNMNVHGYSPPKMTFMKRSSDDGAIVKRIKCDLAHSKYFRDAIYMYTYTQLCNTAEDIVSVIESTMPF